MAIGERRTRDAEGVEFEAPMIKASRRWGMGMGISLPSRLGGLGERRTSPQRGLGHSPGEKRFYCFLSVSERLSLQRLLKINVVHSRPLVEKMGLLSG